MKSPLSRCERWQEDICLLASGALAGQDKAAVEGHLGTCPNCRQRFAELTRVFAPLADWEQDFAYIEPSQAAQLRWATAVHQAAETQLMQGNPLKFFFTLLWRELIWPCRRTWAGLAAAWLAILVFNQSQADGSPVISAKSPTPPGEIRLALREQQRVLEEILGPRTLATPAEPPRRLNNQPRSERRTIAMA